jgi:2-keto-4-pentenoate hydratase
MARSDKSSADRLKGDTHRGRDREQTVMEENAVRRAAETLLTEHRMRARFKTLNPCFGISSLSDAYDIQDRYVALLRAGEGEPIGYKVGLTSSAMQTFCGIDHPLAGVVLANRVRLSGETVDCRAYGRLGLEFEIAVCLKSDLPAEVGTPGAVAPYVDGVCAAIELVDDRAADYGNLDVRSLVADNAWNVGIVLSQFVATWPDLGAVPGTALKDGAPVGEGHGRDILGHPFNSVAWLNAHLASRGGGLRKGQIIMTGSVMKTAFPTEPARYQFDVTGLGTVAVNVVA